MVMIYFKMGNKKNNIIKYESQAQLIKYLLFFNI